MSSLSSRIVVSGIRTPIVKIDKQNYIKIEYKIFALGMNLKSTKQLTY